jgi:hypothetical protein
MRSSSTRFAGLLVSVALGVVVACGDDDEAGPNPDGGAGESAAGASGGGSAAQAGQGGTSSEAGSTAGGAPGELEEVTIQFRAAVGEAEFACGEAYAQQGATEATVTPQDLRFFVENVRLIDADDKEVPLLMDERAPFQTSKVALLDFEDGSGACANGNPELNSTITGKVPPGNYVGVVFSTAVPEDLNHADPTTLPAPLQAGGMTWGWLFGFRFLKAEMVPVLEGGAGGAGGSGHGGSGHSAAGAAQGGADHAGGAPHAGGADGSGHEHGATPGGVFHLGSVECSNSEEPDLNAPPTTACEKQFRNEIRLDDFDPRSGVIVADVGALFSGVDLAADSQCHSFSGAVCPALFQAVGLDYETDERVDGQTFFRAED